MVWTGVPTEALVLFRGPLRFETFGLVLSGVTLVQHEVPASRVAPNSLKCFLDRVNGVDNYFSITIFINAHNTIGDLVVTAHVQCSGCHMSLR